MTLSELFDSRSGKMSMEEQAFFDHVSKLWAGRFDRIVKESKEKKRG